MTGQAELDAGRLVTHPEFTSLQQAYCGTAPKTLLVVPGDEPKDVVRSMGAGVCYNHTWQLDSRSETCMDYLRGSFKIIIVFHGLIYGLRGHHNVATVIPQPQVLLVFESWFSHTNAVFSVVLCLASHAQTRVVLQVLAVGT